MASFVRFHSFYEALAEKQHNLGSDALKIALTNTAPALTATKLSDITQIAGVNGYTTGGAAVTVTSSAQTAGAYKLIANDVTFTAAGGDIGPFRYLVLYNDTTADDLLIAYADYGLSYTLPSGQNFIADFDPSAGIFTLQ